MIHKLSLYFFCLFFWFKSFFFFLVDEVGLANFSAPFDEGGGKEAAANSLSEVLATT
jgi:hypothetical protein